MSEDEGTILELENVYKQYDNAGADTQGTVSILQGISLEIQNGQSLGVVGPSGSGKSTLLNIMGGLDSPSKGFVYVNGRDLSQLPERELARVRNQDIGFIFQLHHLLPQCTVWENVMVPTLPFSSPRDSENLHERAAYLLQSVGMLDRRDHRPAQLSGGERQRVAVVRALINQPNVLLADEPTGSLDQQTAANLIDLLLQLNETQNVTLVVVTHADELARRMNQIYRLRNGELKEA